MKIIKKLKAFTLVELIIVITILAILATIAFVSFQGYVKDSRDSTRLTTLKNIQSGLQAFQVKTGNYPEPENYTLVQASGLTLGIQGTIGDTISKQIKINKTPLDPLDQTKFMYSSNGQKTKYQLLGYFEKPLSVVNSTYAADYTQRIPKVEGNIIGLFLDGNFNSISGNNIDILKANSGSLYNVYFGNNDTVFLSGNSLFSNIYNRRIDLLQDKSFASFDDSLVLYYDMETLTQSGGYKVLQDFSKYNNYGFCYDLGLPIGCFESNLGPQLISSQSGKKLYFDGAGDWLNINTSFFLGLPTKDFTISSIISTTQQLPQRYMISASGNGGSGFRYGMYGTGMLGFLYGSSVSAYVEKDISTSQKFTEGNTYLYTMRFILNNKVETYINGNLVATDSILNKGYSGALNGVQAFWLARMGNNYYQGNLDEMRIYNRGLSDSEIKELYNSIK